MSTAQLPCLEPGVHRSGSINSSANSLEQSIDAHPRRAFLALTFLYALAVVCLSHFKLLWLDELITLHVARLPGTLAIWSALAKGADPNPPLTYILVHASRSLFGERELALRLPAAVGYWIGLLSIFLYLLRRMQGIWALSGAVLSMCMASFEYSYESRSYGIFYGLAMLAFFLWSRATDSELTASEKRNALIGMTLALAAGISTNYFAVLAFLPIGIGELTRTILHLRTPRTDPSHGAGDRSGLSAAVDLRIWVALAVAATPLLVYRPLIARSIAEFAPYAWNKVSIGQVYDSYTEMVEVILYPILGLFLVALIAPLIRLPFKQICTECRSRIGPRWLALWINRRTVPWPVPSYESAGIFGLMTYPILGYLVASIRGGMLSPRFVIPVCFGFSIAAVLVVYRFFGQGRRTGLWLLLFCLAWFLCRESVVGYMYSEQKECFYKILTHLPEAEASVPSGAPIVIADPLLALTFQHYAPSDITPRVIFPVDFPAIRSFRHDDSPEENLWAGRSAIYSLRIVPIATLQHNAGLYLIIASDGNWLLQDLSYHRYTYTRLPINTRAGAIGGFTPLAHGVPSFYTASGDRSSDFAYFQKVIPFRAEDNLPGAKLPISN